MMSQQSPVIVAWHAYMASGDFAVLDALLDEDAVFESPVVHTPQRGKAITLKYLQSAAQVFGKESFAYVGEWHGEKSAILEFTDTLDGISVNGVDMIWWNDAGKITRFKVMVRPLKAVNMLHQKMGEMLARGA
jgi:ketosteroid isomerase-like protein